MATDSVSFYAGTAFVVADVLAAVDSVHFRAGTGMAFVEVSWQGQASAQAAERSIKSWLPAMNEPFGFIGNQPLYVTPRFYKFMDEVAKRLGGINGPTVTQVVEQVITTRDEVLSAQSSLSTLNADIRSVAATAGALREVAINEALSGAATVPEVELSDTR